MELHNQCRPQLNILQNLETSMLTWAVLKMQPICMLADVWEAWVPIPYTDGMINMAELWTAKHTLLILVSLGYLPNIWSFKSSDHLLPHLHLQNALCLRNPIPNSHWLLPPPQNFPCTLKNSLFPFSVVTTFPYLHPFLGKSLHLLVETKSQGSSQRFSFT